jgi:hypothetical protein
VTGLPSGAVWGPLLLVLATAAPAAAAGSTPTSASTSADDKLGTLEQQALDEALAARGLTRDPTPAGKRVGTIHVVNHEVFSSRDGYFQLLNLFHVTSREHVIRREVLLRAGTQYDQALVDETMRNLRDAELTSLVVIVPVANAQPGTVDLLVVTRDVWSLRFNTDFEHQEGTLLRLNTSLSENNLFGLRKRVSFLFDLYQGTYSFGPAYVDPNVLGTRLTFSASYQWIFDRAADEQEGSYVSASVAYPLFSLASRWGAGVTATRAEGVTRLFNRRGDLYRVRLDDLASLRPPPVEPLADRDARLGDRPQPASVPYIYRYDNASLDSNVVRSFGARVIHRAALGHVLSSVRPGFHDSFPTDALVRRAFARLYFPRSERVSALYASYSLFTPRYRVYRDFATFDLREDVQLGPGVFFRVLQAARALGSEVDYTSLSANLSWAFDWRGGYQRLWTGWSGRFLDGDFVDEVRSGAVTLATPPLARLVRVVGSGSLTTLRNSSRAGAFYAIGGESGLRGYGINEFLGRATYVAHLEARSGALPIYALRFGGVVFYDVGHAAPSLSTLRAYHDVGLGLRLLIPQLNFYVLRADWAVPLQTVPTAPAGLPGRFSFGFRQVF